MVWIVSTIIERLKPSAAAPRRADPVTAKSSSEAKVDLNAPRSKVGFRFSKLGYTNVVNYAPLGQVPAPVFAAARASGVTTSR